MGNSNENLKHGSKANRSASKFPFGPALLVTAAFIGPGTVTTASKTGASTGYVLLWAIVFAVVATIVLQEMAARLGIVTGKGLSAAIHSSFKNVAARWAMLALVLGAILFGNAAYQTGNLVGAATGLEVLTNQSFSVWVYVIGATALVVVWIGRLDVLQVLLTGLVVVMSLLFVAAAVICRPDWSAVATGLIPAPDSIAGSEWAIIALIGTTVVPYNLFLHANSAAEKWSPETDANEPGALASKVSTDMEDESHDRTKQAIRSSKLDTLVAVAIGGIITASILISAAGAFAADGGQQFAGVKDIALQLRPAVGPWAEILFAIGLLAAGLTSAITAPIAAGYAASGCFGWPAKLSDYRLKLVATGVIVAGVLFGVTSSQSPTETIIVAQIANGLLLPIIAIFLLVTLNRKSLMGLFKNNAFQNVAAIFVIVVTLILAARQFNGAWAGISKLLGLES